MKPQYDRQLTMSPQYNRQMTMSSTIGNEQCLHIRQVTMSSLINLIIHTDEYYIIKMMNTTSQSFLGVVWKSTIIFSK